MEALVFKGNEGQALTNSLLVAEKFEKRHADVLRAIDDLLSKLPENECKRNFAILETRQIQMPNGGNRDERVLAMTRDGFTLLVMGFTGEKALRFKLDYIEAFNQMEKALKDTNSLSPAEYLLRQAQMMLENERRMNALENKIDEIEQRTTTDLKHSTVVAYVSRNNISLDVNRYGAIGTKASNLCKKRGIETSKVNDPRWGSVRVYPDEILEEVFAKEESNKNRKS